MEECLFSGPVALLGIDLRRVQHGEQLVVLAAEVLELVQLGHLAQVKVHAHTPEVAVHHVVPIMMSERQRIRRYDILLWSIAKLHGVELITLNLHFDHHVFDAVRQLHLLHAHSASYIFFVVFDQGVNLLFPDYFRLSSALHGRELRVGQAVVMFRSQIYSH